VEEAGYIAGRDVMIEYRWVGEHDRLPFEQTRAKVLKLMSGA
jgi:hypothetical protein